MSAKYLPRIYINQAASSFTFSGNPDPATSKFHEQLPGYVQTPVISLDTIAKEVNVGHVLLKDESCRLGLPAFKILGASWAAYRAVTDALNLSTHISLEELAGASKGKGLALYAATDGNHGRAVARMGKLLDIPAFIYVPKTVPLPTREFILGEGATLAIVAGDYDLAVEKVYNDAKKPGGILIQDTSFPGYEDIPKWIVDGYTTMLLELDTQCVSLFGRTPDVVVSPVGVGCFAHAVAQHYMSTSHPQARILTVEPDTAACLKASLLAGEMKTIPTSRTIMDGLYCGTVSSLAWPLLKGGVDVSTSVSDWEAHHAVQDLLKYGVEAGPCGASTLAGLRNVAALAPQALGLGPNTIVALLCTEGARTYPTPLDVTIDDPVTLTQQLVRIDSSNPDLSKAGGAGEVQIAEYVAAWLAHREFDVHILEATVGRPSVVGVAKGAGGGKSLMFNGHIDTVTNAGYKGDPLSGNIIDGSVHGRGSFDMKGGVAASMIAAARGKISGLKGDIIVAAVADEENLSLGTEELLDAGWRADAAIISEPSYLQVTLSHRGFAWFEVTIHGKAAHGSRPELGIDAIVKAGYFLVELDKLGSRLAQDKGHALLGNGTVHAGLVKGGEEPSSYPAQCTITVERRTVPGETDEVVEAQLCGILDNLVAMVPNFAFSIKRITSRAPFQADTALPFTQLVLKHVKDVLKREPVWRAEPFWTDAALLADAGIPSVLFGVDGNGAHAATEWATVESIGQVTEALTRVACEWCA
ncbi:acetylornithine deacetylase [Dacryopinax primogenitus]|uniref:Probable succinyl-diaminopimelate desuccinylase n=1 Tax=Dacryopinax primogenitus (strain DJM 731) TaxID=1858805 RepID=M5FN92_DACPD|nr:acetylornithine deacetylase [Dacryopinax primogenitus]EJT97040.1 acetylornithine deacetylase [Dacryopinax primogenitus]